MGKTCSLAGLAARITAGWRVPNTSMNNWCGSAGHSASLLGFFPELRNCLSGGFHRARLSARIQERIASDAVFLSFL